MIEDDDLCLVDYELQALSLVGMTIDERYKLERLLGQGGMGSVYLASDELLGRQVVIKIMHGGPMAKQNAARFFREARSLAHLNHPNIVTLYDYGWYHEQAYLVMEFAAGVNLRAILGGKGETVDVKRRWTIREALNVAIVVANALSYAHRQGIIHRDIKPENIIIGDQIKLTDFGIAKIRQYPSITMIADVMGTPVYMAPEQALGKEIDERTDLYSFGVVLYEMLTGWPPFSPSDEVSIVSQHLQITPVPPSLRNPEIPKRLDRLILKMLSKDSYKRPASSDEVLYELEAARQDLPTTIDTELPKRKSVVPEDEAKVEALRSIPLFATIPFEDLCELSREVTSRQYRKGTIIFHKDDVGYTFHIVKIGKVKISIPSEKGDDAILSYLGPGDFFGELTLLDEKPRSATATAVEYTETLALERADFLAFLKWHPDLAIHIFAVLAQRLRDLNSQLESIIFFDPPARLAKTLVKLVDTCSNKTPEGWEISSPVTRSELARMTGVSTSVVRRLLSDFQAAGVLSFQNQRYIIYKPEELRMKACRGAGRG
ncbi:MAG: protein kinase [Chloroflexota bacterium]|nr:protein kinase [Chloroflexota bacterium]